MSSSLAKRAGSADLLLITFDALRYDVARDALVSGGTPCLQSLVGAWEERHAPGNFTYAAHAAIFAGFFPTPAHPGRHTRPFALRFAGSRSIGPDTCVLEGANIIEGLRNRGYHTICIGGVGFFNRQTPLGSVFPNLFDEAHWEPRFGVSSPESAGAQVARGIERLAAVSAERPALLFMNFSATHPPTRIFVRGAAGESTATQRAALERVDAALPALWRALRSRGRGGFGFLMSDHGTCFGEDGWTGHRIGCPPVWTVPYGECQWEGTA